MGGANLGGMSAASGTHSCGCIGPQNGEPFCPCKMRGVIVRDGRYVMPERDLGPVQKVESERFDHLLSDMDDLASFGKALFARHKL